ncbi:MAG: helix-turn-helix transcriptional regulator [Clostridia bacterium]|nr:helix-turn-helix transcriptional regulator [Clostridia bacterium]MBR1684626.1 helix-turn-helix transcriptional regulator [Clostridia bacterium]
MKDKRHYYRLKELRKYKELTQVELCEKLDLYKTTYCNYEQGKRELPTSLAIRLAEFYDVSLDYLVERTDIRTPYGKEVYEGE